MCTDRDLGHVSFLRCGFRYEFWLKRALLPLTLKLVILTGFVRPENLRLALAVQTFDRRHSGHLGFRRVDRHLNSGLGLAAVRLKCALFKLAFGLDQGLLLAPFLRVNGRRTGSLCALAMLLRQLLCLLGDLDFVLPCLHLSVDDLLLFLRFNELPHKLQMVAVKWFKRFLDLAALLCRKVQPLVAADEPMLVGDRLITLRDKMLSIVEPKHRHQEHPQVINKHRVFFAS